MKIHPRCYICQIKRVISEVQLIENRAFDDIDVIKNILEFYSSNTLTDTTEMGVTARKLLSELTGENNPYKQYKKDINEFSSKVVVSFSDLVNNFKDPYDKFYSSCFTSVIGNLMEWFLLEHTFDKNNLTKSLKTERFIIDDTKKLFNFLKTAKNFLFLTDNAGEIFFDALLIKTIKEIFPDIVITVAVKSEPIINDATMEDALSAGLDKLCDNLITTGQSYIGLDWNTTSDEFREYWRNSDLIISKGMGHFETFYDNYSYFNCPLFQLLRIKCSTLAEALNVEIGSNVAKLYHFQNND